MKRLNAWSLLAMLLLLLPAITSCDKDDDKEELTQTEINSILGTYAGTLNYSVGGYAPGTIDGTFDLKIMKDPNDKDDVVVVIPECTFTPPIPNAQPFTIPSITVDDVDVTVKGNVYTFEEDSFSLTVDGKEYKGSNLTGTVEGKKVTLKYQVVPANMPMPILFFFDGNVK